MRRPFCTAVLLVTGTTLAAGCASDRATAPPDAAPVAAVAPAVPASAFSPSACPAACERAVARARVRLERAAAGLTYVSESDYAFEFVSAAATADRARPQGDGRRGDVDDALLRAAFGVPEGELVEPVSLDEFFARHIERVDPADRAARALVPRYRALKRAVHAATGATRVYRVGRVQVRCYLVGRDVWGNVVGLATTAIET